MPYNGMGTRCHGGPPAPPASGWGIIDYDDLSEVTVAVDLLDFAVTDYN